MSMKISGVTYTGQLKVSDRIPPLLNPDTFSTDFDTPVTGYVTTNDNLYLSDVYLVSPAGNGNVTLQADGYFEYAPNNDFSGVDSFVYGATNADGTSQIEVNITVGPAPTPITLNDNFIVTYETVFSGNVAINDTPEVTATYSVVTDVTHGTLVLSGDGSFTYTPDNGYVGADSFVYRADSYGSESADTTVSLTVSAPPNHVVFTNPGNYVWTVPDGVTSVCCVVVGAGGSSYTAGTGSSFGSYVTAAGGTYNNPYSRAVYGGTHIQGGGRGGAASTSKCGVYTNRNSCGGGAGGYTANGGDGLATQTNPASGGGGVGLYGGAEGGGGGNQGGSCTGFICLPGYGGSGGSTSSNTEYGGIVGGGAGRADATSASGGGGGALGWGNNIPVTPGQQITVVVGDSGALTGGLGEGRGGKGAVRILWGAGRAFPNTNVSSATN